MMYLKVTPYNLKSQDSEILLLAAYMVNSHETSANKFLVSDPINIVFIMMHMKCMCAY